MRTGRLQMLMARLNRRLSTTGPYFTLLGVELGRASCRERV